jgi:hypothetical protein
MRDQNGAGALIRTATASALAVIAVLIFAASAVSFAESYRGLAGWAREHRLPGIWAAAWPLQVDVFIAVGELSLFIALANRWPLRSRVAAWAVTIAGLAVSVAGNVGHVGSASLAARCTAAVPPLAAAAALAVGLGILKRIVADRPAGHPAARAAVPSSSLDAARMAYAASVAGGNPLAERALSDRFGITRPAAKKIRAGLASPHDAPAAAVPSPADMATAATAPAAAGALNGRPAEGGSVS